MNEILLTIAIPTYNRSEFLKRNLENILLQKDNLDRVELIVSDNASTDDSSEVVSSFISAGLNIQYIRNEENKGPDLNIAQCYVKARGKYVLALGDDDYLLPGSISAIISILETNEDYGVVFLYSGKPVTQKSDALDYRVYVDYIKFIKKVNFYVTFISGNIINKKYLDVENLYKYKNTYLIQVSYILDAILKSKKNVYVNTNLLYVEPDNSGGYNLFKIFGENFKQIIRGLRYDKNKINAIENIIYNSLLVQFFPQFILKLKLNKNHSFVDSNPVLFLKPIFKGYLNFWLCCYPLYCLPNKLAIIYGYGIKVYAKLRSIVKG